MPTYEEAIEALYRGAPESFVAERKRLVLELKAAGDKDGAKKLGALEKPSISVWAVNQLYWHERKRFDELLALAAKLRAGDLKVAAAHREALAELRRSAAERLRQAGNSANEATLRKVSASLAAIAAAGGFEPDPPGALRADRDPPGFGEMDAASFAALPKKTAEARGSHAAHAATKNDGEKKGRAQESREREREKALEKEAREQEARARKEREEQRAAAKSEQRRLQTELRAAESELEKQTRELERQRRRVSEAEDDVAKARRALERVTERLRELE